MCEKNLSILLKYSKDYDIDTGLIKHPKRIVMLKFIFELEETIRPLVSHCSHVCMDLKVYDLIYGIGK